MDKHTEDSIKHGETSISDAIQHCLTSFERAEDFLSARPDGKTCELHTLQDEFARFRMWSGSVVSQHETRGSLDFRLRDASLLRGQTIDSLNALRQCLTDGS
jgi:hypothetical protein